MLQNPHVLLTSGNVQNPSRLPRKTTSERQRVLPTRQFFTHLTSKCASRHNGVHFQHLNFQKCSELVSFLNFWLRNVLRATTACTLSTCQLPKVVRHWGVLCNFDLERCFAPQQRAHFWHLNFQKWSEHEVLCTFCLGNVLRATTACNFSPLIWPHGSAPAALASLLSDPPEPQITGKTQCFATTFLPFRAPGSSFFWDFLFFDLLSSLLFSSLLFADSSHLCFSSVHLVGSLTSKLPSTS